MIYANDLAYNLLMKETFMRLRELSCAVTADKDAAKKKSRREQNRARFRSLGASVSSLMPGRVQADE